MDRETDLSASGAEQIPNRDLALPVDLTREYVIGKCDYFASIGIWPTKVVLDPERWLTNFLDNELEHALYLLNAFAYYSSALMDQIFGTAIRTIARRMTLGQWHEFLDNLVVTIVTGEEPNVADSGHLFARKARSLGIPEERIINPDEASLLVQSGFDGPVVFVDDFVGSGHQFVKAWERPHTTPYDSFKALVPIFQAEFYYCPAFCTEFGLKRINAECPEVTVNPGIFIPAYYGALALNSVVWPSKLQNTAKEFIRSTSERAGIPDTNGQKPNDWRGFAGLGLTIAFEDSVPDATLPIIYWDQNGWRPLMRRTA